MSVEFRNSSERNHDYLDGQQRGFAGGQEEDSFGKFVDFLVKRIWLIAGCLALGIIVAALYSALQPKMYTAAAQIEIAADQSSQFRMATAQGPGATDDVSQQLDTEIEILKSRTLALETIKSLHLESNPYFMSFKEGRHWDLSNPMVRNALIGVFERDLDVSRIGHTRLIQIRATTLQPALSALIVNTLIDNYVEHSFRDSYASTVKVSEWLGSQLSGLKQNLEKSQAQMIEYQKELGLAGLNLGLQKGQEGGTVADTKLEEMNRQYATAEVERMLRQARLDSAKHSSPGVLDVSAGSSNVVLQADKQMLAQLTSQYVSLSQSYGPEYPVLKSIKAQMEHLQENVANEEADLVAAAQKDYETASAHETLLRKALDDEAQNAYSKEEKGAQFEFAREAYEANRLLYDGLQERLLEAGVLAGLHSTSVHIVDNADNPSGPSLPRKRVNLAMGIGVGLLLGFAISLIIEALDTNLKNMTVIEQSLGIPLLAAVPAVPTDNLNPAKFREAAVAKGDSAWSRIAESLRGLRTSIMFSRPGAPPKVIMLVSSRPAEGKSTIASLMAVTFGLGGSKVLLIDAELRRPNIHLRFDLPKGRGISSVLTGALDYRDAIVEWPDLPNVHVMASGPIPPLASELLGSKQMENLLREMREQYDFVIIDTPPVLAVTDAVVLGRLSDATILVVRYGIAKLQVVQRCVDVLKRSGANILGVVVNVVDVKSPEYYEYYGKKYYEYAGERKPSE